MIIQLSASFANNIPDPTTKAASKIAIAGLCDAAVQISAICAQGPLADGLGDNTGAENADGDTQKALDVQADEWIIHALKQAPVAYYASEEETGILTLDHPHPLALRLTRWMVLQTLIPMFPSGPFFLSLPPQTVPRKIHFLGRAGSNWSAGFLSMARKLR